MTATTVPALTEIRNRAGTSTGEAYESYNMSIKNIVQLEAVEPNNKAHVKEEFSFRQQAFSEPNPGKSCHTLGSNTDNTVDRVQDKLDDEERNQCGGMTCDFWEEEQKAVLPKRGDLKLLASFGLQTKPKICQQTAGDASIGARSRSYSKESHALPLDLEIDPSDDVGYCLYGVVCKDDQRFKFISTKKKTKQSSSGQKSREARESMILEEESSRRNSNSSSESDVYIQSIAIDGTSNKHKNYPDSTNSFMTSTRSIISHAIGEAAESLSSQRRLVIKKAEEERLALKNHKMPVLDQEEIAARWESLRSTISTSSLDFIGCAKDPKKINHHVIDLLDLQSLADRGELDFDSDRSHRGLAWRVLSGYLPVDQSAWEIILKKDRLTYSNLVQDVFVTPRNKYSCSKSKKNEGVNPHIFGWMKRSKRNIHERSKANKDTNGNETLNTAIGEEDVHDRREEENCDAVLVEEIRRDVSKTHMHLNFFLEEENNLGKRRHAALERLLFVSTKLNKKVKYLNGMSEIAGTIYFVLATDYHEEWAAHAEADTYMLYNMLIFELKELFSPEYINSESGIQKCIAKYNDMLSLHDPELKDHLDVCGINASFYILPWFATLLCREFSVPDTIRLWDAMFASNDKVMFLRYVCCTMMMVIRDDLFKLTDFNEILELLHNFPPIDMENLLQSSRALWRFESEVAHKCESKRTTTKKALVSTTPPFGIIMAYGRKDGIAPKRLPALRKWIVPSLSRDRLSIAPVKQNTNSISPPPKMRRMWKIDSFFQHGQRS